MTIRLLRPYNGYPVQTIVTLDAATEVALVASFDASTDLTGGTNFAPNAPYGNFPMPPRFPFGSAPDVVLFAGREFNATDVGGGSVAQGGGTVLLSNGRRWRPINGETVIDAVDTPNTSTTAAAIQSLTGNRVFMPANLLRAFDRFELEGSLSKSGATDSGTVRVHFGSAGTTADPVIATSTALLAASRSGDIRFRFKLTSSVLMRLEGNQDTTLANNFGFSATVYGAGVTIPDISTNALAFTVSIQKSGAVDTVTLEDLLIKWQATDSV